MDVSKIAHTTLGALMFAPQQNATGVRITQPILVQTPYSDAQLEHVTATDASGVDVAGTLTQRTFSTSGSLLPDTQYTVTATVLLPQDSGSSGTEQEQTQVISFATVTTPRVVSVTPTAVAPAQPVLVTLSSPASAVRVDGPVNAQLNPGGQSVSMYPSGYQAGEPYVVTLTATGLDATQGSPQLVRFAALGGPTVSSSPSSGSTNLGVAIPVTIALSKAPLDRASLAARFLVSTDVTPTVPAPDLSLGGVAATSPPSTCVQYALALQGGGTIPTAVEWLSSTRFQLVPKTPDGYWPPNAGIKVSGDLDSLAAGDGSLFTGTFTSTFQTGDKRVIDVDLSSQTLTACRNGGQDNQFPISSGQQGKETPTGHFAIYSRILDAEMKGGAGPFAPDFYDVKHVPFTQYFNGGDALHGAWWHNNFGHPMSHGCVNVSTPTRNVSWPHAAPNAEYLWNFDNYGDPVIVHGTTP